VEGFENKKGLEGIVRLLRGLTVGIRIVADCGTQIFQFVRKLKRATILEFTNFSAIIFTHYCAFVLLSFTNHFL